MITLLKQYIGYCGVSNRRRKPYIGYCGNQRLDIGLSRRRYGNVAFHHVLSVCKSEHNVCSDLTGSSSDVEHAMIYRTREAKLRVSL